MREQLIRQVEIIPIEVVVRNVAAGSLSKRLGIEEGTQLPRTIIEYYYKDDALGDPMIADEHIACFGWASQDEMNDIADMAIRVNDFLCGMFAAIGIRLVDFKLEFGRVWDDDYARVILADEISPDGCRLWDMKTNEKLDKDRFRQDLGGVAEAYQEVARRLGLLRRGRGSRGPRPRQPPQEARQVSYRSERGGAFSFSDCTEQTPLPGVTENMPSPRQVVTLNPARPARLSRAGWHGGRAGLGRRRAAGPAPAARRGVGGGAAARPRRSATTACARSPACSTCRRSPRRCAACANGPPIITSRRWPRCCGWSCPRRPRSKARAS